MRSRRCLGPGRPAGETKMSGRRVTRKAPLADVERGQAGPRRRPQPFSRILTAWKGYSRKCTIRISTAPVPYIGAIQAQVAIVRIVFLCLPERISISKGGSCA
jgi:hypothetical protein